MAQELSIATFNCENLFDRAKLLNIDDETKSTELLKQFAELQVEIGKAAYDKPETMMSLYTALTGYVNLVETRGFLLDVTRKKVSAKGRADWEGWLELESDAISDDARKSTARVIEELKADVVCLVEVDSRPFLKRFVAERLGGAYAHIMLVDGNDARGIDVGLISKLPIVEVRSHVDDRRSDVVDTAPLFSRDCLEARVVHPVLGDVWLLLNHLKSKRDSDPIEKKKADALRTAQAERIAAIVRARDLEKENVIVLGDLNDTPDSQPLVSLYSKPHQPLKDVMEVGAVDETERWTYHYRGKNQQIDHMLVSAPLAARLSSVHVERRGIADIAKITNGKVQPFPEVTGKTSAASDHGAIVARFDATKQ